MVEKRKNQSGDLGRIEHKIEHFEDKIKEMSSEMDSFSKKIQEFEIKMEGINLRTSRSQQNWDQLIDFVVKIFWVVVASYLLYKLGIQSPSV
jgi:predicted  nucleic acid-binding Zn-ribbon protein